MLGLEALLAIFAPFDCIVCDAEGSVLCKRCVSRYLKVVPARCFLCLESSLGSQVCKTCKSELKHVWVATEYQKVASQLIKRLKFDRAAATASILVESIDAVLPILPPTTVIAHIPTASSRVRQRGYDQAQLVAKQLAKRRRLPFQPLLKRLGQTRQVGANRLERQSQLQNAFRVAKNPPQAVLLIDDVLTTGATIEAAALVLKKAGATTVNAALFAQKDLK